MSFIARDFCATAAPACIKTGPDPWLLLCVGVAVGVFIGLNLMLLYVKVKGDPFGRLPATLDSLAEWGVARAHINSENDDEYGRTVIEVDEFIEKMSELADKEYPGYFDVYPVDEVEDD